MFHFLCFPMKWPPWETFLHFSFTPILHSKEMNNAVSYRFFPPKFLQSKGALSLFLCQVIKLRFFWQHILYSWGYGAHMHILNLGRSFLIQRYDLFFHFPPPTSPSFLHLTPCRPAVPSPRSFVPKLNIKHGAIEQRSTSGLMVGAPAASARAGWWAALAA
jgi:hypothetical protein